MARILVDQKEGIRTVAFSGDFEKIEAEVDLLRKINSNYQTLCDRILVLDAECEDQSILNLIEEH